MFTVKKSGSHKRSSKSGRKPITGNRDKWLWDPGILLLAAGLVTAFALVVLSFMFPGEANSSMPAHSEIYVNPSKVREGSLLFKSVKSGQYVPAPQLKTSLPTA